MQRKKRRVGRPRSNADNMSEVFQVRCTPEDYLRWKNAAKSIGLPLGTWIRMTVLKAEIE